MGFLYFYESILTYDIFLSYRYINYGGKQNPN